MSKTIYDLELHKSYSFTTYEFEWIVTRVPGGFLYTNNSNNGTIFVPLSNEFQTKTSPPPIPRKEINN